METIGTQSLQAGKDAVAMVPAIARLIMSRGIPEGDADPTKASRNLRLAAIHLGDDVGEPEKRGRKGDVPMSRAQQLVIDVVWPTQKDSDFIEFETEVRVPLEAAMAVSEILGRIASTWYLQKTLPRPFQGANAAQIVRFIWVIEYKNFSAAPARFI